MLQIEEQESCLDIPEGFVFCSLYLKVERLE